jgi:hypothetical protein
MGRLMAVKGAAVSVPEREGAKQRLLYAQAEWERLPRLGLIGLGGGCSDKNVFNRD